MHFFNQEVKLRLKEGLSYLPSSALQSFKDESLEIESISKKYFNGSMTWPFNIVADNWSDIKGSFFGLVAYKVDNMNITVKNSLQNAMSVKDDF